MRKILFCFLALLLVVMIALIASVGPAAPMSEPATPYVVWNIPVIDVQAAVGIAPVALLVVILVNISSGALFTSRRSVLWVKGILTQIYKAVRPGFSWRTPLIKPI